MTQGLFWSIARSSAVVAAVSVVTLVAATDAERGQLNGLRVVSVK